MIEISLLRVLGTKIGYDKVHSSIPMDALEPRTKAIVQDISKYYSMFPQHTEIDVVQFKDMFFTHWHKGLAEEEKAFYAKIIDHADKPLDAESRSGVINGMVELNLADKMLKALDKYNAGEEIDIVSTTEAILENAKGSRERREETNWVDPDMDKLLQEDNDSSGLTWFQPSLANTSRPIRHGDLIIVAGRPDTGKTTFTAGEVTNMADQMIGSPEGLTEAEIAIEKARPIFWFNNEGAGDRILKRVVQAGLQATIPEMQAMQQEKTLVSNYEKAIGCPMNTIRVINIHDYWNWQVEELVEEYQPKLVVMDMIDNIKFSGLSLDGGARTDQILEQMYQWARNMGVKHNLGVIATSQISNDGEGLQFPDKSMLKDSKTGKQGAAEMMIMLGRGNDPMTENSRFISTPKNKLRLPGVQMPRAEVYFNIDKAVWLPLGT